MHWQDLAAFLRALSLHLPLDTMQRDEVKAFGSGFRGFDYAQPTLQRCLITNLPKTSGLSEVHQRALIEKVLQGRDWDEVARHLQLAGRKPLLRLLRRGIEAIEQEIE